MKPVSSRVQAMRRPDRRRRKSLSPRVVIVGHGAVGRCVVSLLCGHFEVSPDRITVLDAKAPDPSAGPYQEAGLTYLRKRFQSENMAKLLAPVARRGDLLINVSTGIDSLDLAHWCQQNGVLYVDTTLDTWDDGEASLGVEQTEYAGHQRVRSHAARHWRPDGPTAIFTHGANPGLVSHFVKAALLDVARAMDLDIPPLENAEDWAALAQATGTKVIHISEWDGQVSRLPRAPGEIPNTWSVDGLVKEGLMLGEFGWGTHEEGLPPGAHHHSYGPRNAIYLDQRGAEIRLRSWVPGAGPMVGLGMPHSECVTLSDYLSLRRKGRAVYRPTVAFVYRPCEPAVAGLQEVMASRNRNPAHSRIMYDDITEGRDELGVLLLGHGLNGWWYGSQLDIEEARRLAPGQNATVVQVAAGVVAAALWALRHPAEGFCEPEDLPHQDILDLARPYLGPMVSLPVDWRPAGQSVPSDLDGAWQWAHFQVGTVPSQNGHGKPGLLKNGFLNGHHAVHGTKNGGPA